MRLVRLHLKHFRQHRDTAIEFQTGLTGIIGNNGVGKTSLIEGIAFALFGTKAIRGKIDELRTRGIRKDTALEVSLSFEHAGQTFRIERGSVDARLYLGGGPEPVSQGTREVSDRCSSILGMNYEEFLATFFTEQKGLEFLSGKKGATERERFIVRMMGYDRLERVQEILRSDRRDKKNEIAGWEAGAGLRSDIEQRIAVEEQQLGPLQARHDEAQRVLTSAEKELKTAGLIVSAMEEKRPQFEAVSKREQELTIRQQELTERMKLISTEIVSARQSAAITGAVDQFRAELQKRTEELQALQLTASQIDSELQRETLSWKEQLATFRAELRIKVSENQALEQKVRELRGLTPSAPCPTCAQELGASFEGVKCQHEESAAAAAAQLAVIKAQCEVLEAPPEHVQRLGDRVREIQIRMSETEQHLSKLRSGVTAIERIERLEQELSPLSDKHQLWQRQLVELRSSIEAMEFSPAAFNKATLQSENCARLLELARLQRLKVENDLNIQSAHLQRTRASLVEHDQRVASLNVSKRELLVLEEGDAVLSDFRRSLNALLRPRLSEIASEFLAELTDGRYTAVEIGNDFSPTVLEDGEIKPVISGGEEDLLNLCVRLALSQLLAERAGQNFSLLVLDEVFGSLDEQRRTNLLSLLERLNKRFDQVLVITHLDDIREGVHNLLTISYDDGNGTVVVVDEFRQSDQPLAANI